MSSEKIELDIDGSVLDLEIRFNARARRFILRVPPNGGSPAVTIPPYGTIAQAKEFATKNKNWLRRQLEERPPPVPFKNGVVIPFKGEDHKIQNIPEIRGNVNRTEEMGKLVLNVYGDPQFLSRRLTDWLKDQAKSDISAFVQKYTDEIKIKPTRIKIGDQHTRWGSCSQKSVRSKGSVKFLSRTLSFSWRLILMPPKILEYVVAHEVAHLLEMNHSDRFWEITFQLCNHTHQSRAWLRYNGYKYLPYGLSVNG